MQLFAQVQFELPKTFDDAALQPFQFLLIMKHFGFHLLHPFKHILNLLREVLTVAQALAEFLGFLQPQIELLVKLPGLLRIN